VVVSVPPRSKIEALPKPVREWLDRALVEGGHSGFVRLSQELAARGYSVGKTAIGTRSQMLERRLAALKASTDAARLIAEAAPDDADHRSAAVIGLVQSDLFEALLAVQEAETAPPGERLKLLNQAARAIADLSRASRGQKEWEEEVRRRTAEELVKRVTEDARGSNGAITPDRLRAIIRESYGVDV